MDSRKLITELLLLSRLSGVNHIRRDEIRIVLPSIAMLRGGNPAPVLASTMRPNTNFDFGGILVVNGLCYKFNTFLTV
jgi:hypothetical protein